MKNFYVDYEKEFLNGPLKGIVYSQSVGFPDEPSAELFLRKLRNNKPHKDFTGNKIKVYNPLLRTKKDN